jgi:hypothetical protein
MGGEGCGEIKAVRKGIYSTRSDAI